MDQAAKRYLTRLGRALVCSKKDRERLLDDAREMLENFAQENPGAFYQDYVASFGQPQDFAREMLSGLDPEDVAEAKLRRRRALIGAGIAAAAVLALLVGIWFGRQSQQADPAAPTAEPTADVTEDPASEPPDADGTPSPTAGAVSYVERKFTDSDDINYKEAVGVLVKLGVISGRPDGAFDPSGTVTRAEAAKLIAITMNGGSDPATGVKEEPSFPDIGGNWAESSIEYCVDLGVISTEGDEPFRPSEDVTGFELVKMALAALGYDPLAYQLNGPSWQIRTDELARQAEPGLYTDLVGFNPNVTVTRESAAQILYNTLQNKTKVLAPAVNMVSGAVTWEFQMGEYTLLHERFGIDLADIAFD